MKKTFNFLHNTIIFLENKVSFNSIIANFVFVKMSNH